MTESLEGSGNGVAYVVMGVCGCGKSTVAKGLADVLGIEMLDADDFHPPANVEKMRAGIPLDDADRAGWLAGLNRVLKERTRKGESVALACSALKQRYRDALAADVPRFQIIYLKGSREMILERMASRKNHFMPTSLVDSQLAALEEPQDAVVVDIAQSPGEILERLRRVFVARK